MNVFILSSSGGVLFLTMSSIINSSSDARLADNNFIELPLHVVTGDGTDATFANLRGSLLNVFPKFFNNLCLLLLCGCLIGSPLMLPATIGAIIFAVVLSTSSKDSSVHVMGWLVEWLAAILGLKLTLPELLRRLGNIFPAKL